MSTQDRWLLPEGIEEVLPAEARRLERLRRQALDLFARWGYELVMPPMIEFLDALLTGTGQELDIQTFKLTDQVGGRLMGVRADMTPQVARIEAHYLKRSGPVRLCYLGPVLFTRAEEAGASREPLQLGAELFGHRGPESDVEIIELLLAMLDDFGVPKPHLDLGNVGVFQSLAASFAIAGAQREAVFEALQRKSRPDLETLLDNADARRLFCALTELNGDVGTLDEAAVGLAKAGPGVSGALDNLRGIAGAVGARCPHVPIYIDLAEVEGHRYYTGLTFSVFAPGHGKAVARGGRYDNIGQAFGTPRPATGFSADLRTLLRLLPVTQDGVQGIRAPAQDDAALAEQVRALRQRGERVVRALPNIQVGQDGCDRQLVLRDSQWIVESL